MSDFNIEILENNSSLEVESSILNTLEINQNNLILENDITNIISHSIEIEKSESAILQINTEYVGSVIFAGDIIGLDTFVANFIDNYEIDCGSP
jgi:hypothetical protein